MVVIVTAKYFAVVAMGTIPVNINIALFSIILFNLCTDFKV